MKYVTYTLTNDVYIPAISVAVLLMVAKYYIQNRLCHRKDY